MEELWPFLREASTSSWQCWAFYSLCKLFHLGKGRTDPLLQFGIITGVKVKYVLKEEQKQSKHSTICCCSVAQSCPTLCSPMGCSMPGFSLLQCLPEFAQTHVHWISDAIQPSHFLSPPSHNTISGLISESLIQDTKRVTCLPSAPWIPSHTMPLSNLNHLVLVACCPGTSQPNLASSALGLLCTAHQIQSNTYSFPFSCASTSNTSDCLIPQCLCTWYSSPKNALSHKSAQLHPWEVSPTSLTADLWLCAMSPCWFLFTLLPLYSSPRAWRKSGRTSLPSCLCKEGSACGSF